MLSIKKILFPTNCSEAAKPTLAFTLAVAKYFHAEVVILYVCELKVDTMAPSVVRYQLLQEEKHKAEQVLDAFLKDFGTHHVPVTKEVEIGFAKENIIAYTERNPSIDLIVMSSHDTTSMIQRKIWGTTISTVIDNAQIPILVIPKGIVFQDIKKMAYLTPNKDHWQKQHPPIQDLAHYFKAQLLVVHLAESQHAEKELPQHFVLENYEEDLPSFIHNHNLHLLVTVTTARTALQRLLRYSSAQKMALNTTIPLLVWK